MDTFRFQDSDNDGSENGHIQNVKYNRHNATQTDLEKDQFCIRKENAQLISEIADLCNRPDRKDPEVLLLLGSVDVGKSAMVNTIIKAMTGKYFHKAKTGSGNEASTKPAMAGQYFHKAKTGSGKEASTTLAFEWQISYSL
ncbi:uncharacterized protein LOC127833722 [Dreissena polymorpha]|uniref:Uncharacterized protein n=1 Tax=Dreissena polymorpha TaxID=45954 RepID=A0A9D4G265_DREPO|nr:uncharacterized protein LOC127833722 [Dreissena polymorpha]KAH3808752.1 hypothetical protein DPMN_137110 [Dreissena polymorpha]